MISKIHEGFIVGLVAFSIFVLGATFMLWRDTENNREKLAVLKQSYNVVGDPSSNLNNVTSEFKKIQSEEDKKLIYKLFSGAASYLSVCESLDGTHQFDPILGRVQSSYGWQRDKYPAFTDAVSGYLISVGYDKPKSLESASDRFAFAKIFQDLAEATKNE